MTTEHPVLLNTLLLGGMAALAFSLWSSQRIDIGAVAAAVPLARQCTMLSGWVPRMVALIFENLGMVQDSMRSLTVPAGQPDAPDAVPLKITQGEIRFDAVRFGYGSGRGVPHGVDLLIRERVGLVGPSGAGKSTLVNLLLGFYALDAGRTGCRRWRAWTG